MLYSSCIFHSAFSAPPPRRPAPLGPERKYHFDIHPDPLSLAIPPYYRKAQLSTGDGFGQQLGRNGEFCVTVGPVNTTAGKLASVV